MFGKKENKQQTSELSDVVGVETIPEMFYGGKDPAIYGLQKAVAGEEAKKKPVKKVEKKKPEPNIPPPSPVQKRKFNPDSKSVPHVKAAASGGFISRHKGAVIGIGIFAVLGIGGILWYYLVYTAPKISEQVPVPPVIEQTVQELSQPAQPEPVPEPISEPIPEPVSLGPDTLDFPVTILSDSNDLDVDFLTDSEEEIFNTDSGVWDTDADGYYDGQEVVNLYNPAGFTPVRLIDSGFIREYLNPKWEYRLYYPVTWELASVDTQGDQVLVSDISGDYIEVRAVPKLREGETFTSWFAREAQGQIYTDFKQVKNRFGIMTLRRNDGLVGFVDAQNVVYVLLYHPQTNGPIAFRHIMEMALQSFRPTTGTAVLPEQIPVPPTPLDSLSATTTESESASTLETDSDLIITQPIESEPITTANP